jgi:hypothetical protein
MEVPVLGTEEVRLTEGIEPVEETVDAPTPMIQGQTLEENGARNPMDTVLISPPSSPVSTAATAVAAKKLTVEHTVREQAEEIMSMLDTVMERVSAWSERGEAQTSESTGHNVTMWRKRLGNYEESLRQKTTSLTEAEKGQAELRQALATKEVELVAARAELMDEWRKPAGTDQIRE